MASLSDILTSAQNLVQAINMAAQTYLQVQGLTNSGPLTAATLVSPKPGRVATISVVTPGSTAGVIYDGALVTDLSRPVFSIATTAYVGPVNLAMRYGIVVVPGTGQKVVVGYS